MPDRAPALDGEYQELPVDKLDFSSWNPNEMDEDEEGLLTENVQQLGFIDPIQVVPLTNGRFRVIGGEHRVRVMAKLGRTIIPCITLTDAKWQDEDLQKFVTVRLNMLRGHLNPEKMVKLHQEMVAKYGAEALQRMFAFTDKAAFAKVLKGVQAGLKKSGLSKGAQEEIGKKVGKAKNLDELGQILSKVYDQKGMMLQQGFIAFTYQGSDSVYIRMTPEMKAALDKLMAYCVQSGENINELMVPVTLQYAEALATKPKS
jgi:hypothetical protein